MASVHTENGGMKQKLVRESRQLLMIFLYLSVFFTVFRVYTRLILAEYEVNYYVFGLTFLKALALAKVILLGEAFHVGERYRHKPLIITTLYKTVLFCLCAFAFEVLEHLLIGLIRGKDLAEVVAEILDKGWAHLVAMTMVVFVAFLPFFAFRETERVLGVGKLQALFFKRNPTSQVPELQDASH
jgi:hypothetical protein